MICRPDINTVHVDGNIPHNSYMEHSFHTWIQHIILSALYILIYILKNTFKTYYVTFKLVLTGFVIYPLYTPPSGWPRVWPWHVHVGDLQCREYNRLLNVYMHLLGLSPYRINKETLNRSEETCVLIAVVINWFVLP